MVPKFMNAMVLKGYGRWVFLILLLAFVHISASATHLRAGEITVTRESCTSLTFNITITVYTNTQSTIHFSQGGAGNLNYGDGSAILHPPEIDNPPSVPGFSDFGLIVYTVSHTYAGPGRYIISYQEPNRNANILNMTNSVNTPFYIETAINIDPILGCDNSPQLLVPPIDKACTGTAWFHNAGAYDPDGDSLSYVMVVPKQDQINDVYGYLDPNSKAFYAGLTYGTANELGTGPPTFGIDPITGTVTWDAPGAQGQYNIAFHIIEWRKIGGTWVQLGYVTRDMQIIVEDCSNKRPDLTVPADICVEAGTVINQDITGTDPNEDPVELQAFSQVFSINPSPATFTPDPPDFQIINAATPATLHFTWNTKCAHVKEQPYQVVFKVSDKPSSGISLVAFKTWNIRVVGPAPKWTSVQAQPQRRAKLVWESYACSNATTMQIWRRVNSFPYDPPQCVTGMPDFLGFTKIDEVPISTTQYTDTNQGRGLSPGAEYCYRLVAVFPLPQGGESYVSKESCFTALGDAPIITNVSIDKTDRTIGEDTIKWVSPIKSDIDTAAFPPPYKYTLYRAEGFVGNVNRTLVFPGKITNTFFIDKPLNTDQTVYNYKVVAFYNDSLVVDTSASASTVRLELKPHLTSMELNWNADVPWSNENAAFPLHYIYRGPVSSTQPSDMVVIDSVNVTQYQFHYVDSGQYHNTPLDKNQTYCYCVRTQGSFGNPKIVQPLINYSQIICAQPNDDTPPCAVVVNATGTDCSKVLGNACSPLTFSNTLTWKHPTAACVGETYEYNIYVAAQVGGTFTLYVQNVKDTFYIDMNLPSYARCYKVSAVNRGGVEGALSDPVCFDNCPHYELPNVFTPGNGDGCNDLFSAYSDRKPAVEGTTLCPARNDVKQRCARFVNAVTFTVFNRWGKEVFTYQSGGENSIYIDWDGRDDKGVALAAGVYYYLAQVNFNVVDPSKRNQTIKGWVQLVR